MGRALGKCFSSLPPSFEIRDKGVFHHSVNNLDHDLEFVEKCEKVCRFQDLFCFSRYFLMGDKTIVELEKKQVFITLDLGCGHKFC